MKIFFANQWLCPKLGLMLIITWFSVNKAITAIIGMSFVIIVLLIWMGKGIMYILKKIKNS